MKRGIILPAVLVLISLLALLAMTRNWFSRQQLHQADMISEREQAYHAADGMRKIAVALVQKAFAFYNANDVAPNRKLEKAESSIRQILEQIIDKNGSLTQKPFEIRLKIAAVDEFIDKLVKSGIKIDEHLVELKFTPIQQLIQSSPSGRGIQPDKNEILWRVLVRSFARVGNGREALLWYRQGRTINLQPPVLGKFSLFVHEPDPASFYGLRVDELNPDGTLKNNPLLITNGRQVFAGSLNPDAARDFIDGQGWIFLGEASDCEIRNPPGSVLVNRGYFEDSLEDHEYLNKKGTFKYFYYCDNYRKSLFSSPDGLSPFGLLDAKDFLSASMFLFNGDEDTQPSPTLVIGRVVRSYPIVQGLAGVKSGLTFPFPLLDENRFSSDEWPCRLKPAEVKMIRRNFSENFAAYGNRMSFIYREAFNAANLQLLKLDKIHEEFAVLQPDNLPFARPPASKRLRVNDNPADYFDFVSGAAYTLVDEASQPLFTEAAFLTLRNLSFMRSKVTQTFSSWEQALEKLERNERGELVIPGAIAVKGAAEIKNSFIPENSGALLIFDSDVIISADLPADNGRMLNLISLGGNIRVGAGRRIDAALVAVDGQITFGAEAFIHGLVACKTFRAQSDGRSYGRIIYDPSFDPTSIWSRNAAYRLNFDLQEYFLVE
jgi:hypothetical protein